MRYVVMYSGGVGSWATAKRLQAKFPSDELVLLFADTFNEDPDLYRFLIESSAQIFGVTDIDDLLEECKGIPPVWERDARKEYLKRLSAVSVSRIPGLMWIYDGRDIWEVFFDEHILGSNRVAPCSKKLKQYVCRKWLKANCPSDDTTVCVGIDWSEDHRLPAIMKVRNKITGIMEGLTLAEFRRRIENQPTFFDPDDWGGCGCFVAEEMEGVADD